MKKNLNIIQIKGTRGIIMAAGIVSCLVAGFVAFPGWVSMSLWNLVAAQINNLPSIGLIQGILLWAIIVAAYFTFRKEKVVVCLKSQEGLSEEELKSVFSELKTQSQTDPILQAMMKAREAELKYKAQQELEKKESEQTSNSDNSTKV